jgi:hypothetical protein
MALVVILGCAFGLVAHRIRLARVQRDAVASIERAGGEVGYDFFWEEGISFNNRLVAPKWMADRIGVDHFGSVKHVIVDITSLKSRVKRGGAFLGDPKLADDRMMAQIGRLNALEMLAISGASATNAGLVGDPRESDHVPVGLFDWPPIIGPNHLPTACCQCGHMAAWPSFSSVRRRSVRSERFMMQSCRTSPLRGSGPRSSRGCRGSQRGLSPTAPTG